MISDTNGTFSCKTGNLTQVLTGLHHNYAENKYHHIHEQRIYIFIILVFIIIMRRKYHYSPSLREDGYLWGVTATHVSLMSSCKQRTILPGNLLIMMIFIILASLGALWAPTSSWRLFGLAGLRPSWFLKWKKTMQTIVPRSLKMSVATGERLFMVKDEFCIFLHFLFFILRPCVHI